MKLKIKIALIALMGINLGMEAQTFKEDLKIEGNSSLKHSSLFFYRNDGAKFMTIGHSNPNDFNSTFDFHHHNGNPFRFLINNNEILRLSSNGNVGIGVSNPNAKLEIRGRNAVYSDFKNYSGISQNSFLPNQKEPTLVISETPSGTYIPRTGGQVTYKGGFSFGRGGSGIYSVNPNPAGSPYYGDIRFHTTHWNGAYYNADRMVIKNNGNIGMGTSNPRQRLELYNTKAFNSKMEFESQDHILLSSTYKDEGELFGGITWESSGRRRASIVATREHNDADFVGLAFFTRGTDGPGAFYESMRISHRGNVGIGTTNPDSKLSVNGKIHTKEVKVDLVGWSDFVFYDDYELPTLTEIETHIKENGHLKDIPSAKEVAKNGIFLGEMDSKLLQKIEELTLYTIAQEKNLQSQKEEINNLKKENETLKSLNFKLIEIQKRLDKLEGKK